MRGRTVVLASALALVAASCGSAGGTPAAGPAPASADRATALATTAPPSTVAAITRPDSVTLPVPTVPPPTEATTTTTSTTAAPPTTAAPVTASPPVSPAAPDSVGTRVASAATDARQVLEIGRSRQGRPILAVERGTPGGTPVLVIGVIHGDEDAGVAILEDLATAPVPDGIDLWLVETMNPDGQAAQRRGNAAGVDLNRNFPYGWGPIGSPGNGQYAGTGPASEPETQAIVSFVSSIRPALTIWYHQDLYRLSPGEGLEGQLKQRYADLTGLPIVDITGGTYTGVAATWIRRTLDVFSFIVELGPTLSPADAARHAAAVLDVAVMAANA